MNAVFMSPWRGPLDIQWSLADIAAEVAGRHGISVTDLRGPNRRRALSWPRQDFMARALETGRFSLNQIGRFLGGRHHTTVLSGARSHAKRIALYYPKEQENIAKTAS